MNPEPSTENATSAGPPMPIFYRRPELLTAERQSGKSLAAKHDFAFARDTNSVPINGVEFGLAQRHYPIVFSEEAAPFPMAILGLRNAENVFVKSGLWEQAAYVPAYIRRYPFVLMTGQNQSQFALCIDAASGLIVDDDTNPLFRGGEPTDVTKNALAFCASFQVEYEKTRAFAAALAEQKLLESRTADIELPGGQKLVFGPFRIVDEAKLGHLSDAVLADWVRRGWYGWIHAHLLSFANWPALASRLGTPS